MGLLTEAATGLRAALPFPGGRGSGRTYIGWGGDFVGGGSHFRLPGERDYRTKVGDGGGTALISAVVNWMMRELVVARRIVYEYADVEKASVPKTLRAHPLLELKRRPNPYYSGTVLTQAQSAAYTIDGNAYSWKERSPEGRVVREWYLPPSTVDPIGRNHYIDFYRYTVTGRVFDLPPQDVRHLRFGLDPTNPRKGMSPLRGVIRELFTDEEASRFVAALLYNLAFPGAVVIPGENVQISDENARKEIRDRFDERFTEDGRGRTVVLSANADVKFLQWSPKELDLSSLRDVPEERVTAAVGIPAAVVGLGTGLQQTKVGATLRESRGMGWEGALIPYLVLDAEADTEQMLPDFVAGRTLALQEIAYDLSRVAALSEMHLRRATTEVTLVRGGVKQVDEARLELGLPPVGGKAGGFMASPGVGGAPAGDGEDEPPRDDEEEETDEGEEAAERADLLTKREREVALLAANGEANKQIAATLDLSERTVERHLARARSKLGLASRAELGRWAARGHRDDETASAVLELAKTIAGRPVRLDVHSAALEKVDERVAAAVEALMKSAAARDAALERRLADGIERGLERGIAKIKPPALPAKVIRFERHVKRDDSGRIAGVDETPIYEKSS